LGVAATTCLERISSTSHAHHAQSRTTRKAACAHDVVPAGFVPGRQCSLRRRARAQVTAKLRDGHQTARKRFTVLRPDKDSEIRSTAGRDTRSLYYNGIDPDRDQCVVAPARHDFLLGEKQRLSAKTPIPCVRLQPDLRITQTVNGNKGVHCMIAKNTRSPKPDTWPGQSPRRRGPARVIF